jgi:signal transduction histidine kinase/CheY-like chemotaxis protein
MTVLLTKDHPITEKGMMEFQPFGKEPDGAIIRDLSGVVIRACVEHLEEYVTGTKDAPAGKRAVQELVQSLNARIQDPAFHVTEDFLKNPWNSYAAEFSAFFTQFCSDISGDPDFQFNMARGKAISPIIQTLLRRFSLPQIYKMSVYIAQRYSRNSFDVDPIMISERWGLLRLTFSERTCRQFGPYRLACARHWCTAVKGYFAGVPEIFHNLPAATVTDRSCVSEGDKYCEWEVAWPASEPALRFWHVGTWLGAMFHVQPGDGRERIIEEQARSLDAWHDELQKAYVQQQQITAELQRRVSYLTTLHDAGLVFASILDREALITSVMQTITGKLLYDRVMLRFFAPERRLTYDARILGVPDEIADFVRSLEVPVTESDHLDATVLLRGEPMLIADVQHIVDRLHPLNRQLVTMIGAKSIIAVPLKVKNRVLGSLTVDRTGGRPLTDDDLNVMVTISSQVAIALDNTDAYREIEELNIGLEAKVRARTAALEQFLARVSHDLRTPLTSICGFADNMLDGLAGPLTDKQAQYLNRMLANGRRLGRLVDNLLDILVDPDKIRLSLSEVDLSSLSMDVIEQLRPLALAKHQCFDLQFAQGTLTVCGDADKLARVLTNVVDNAIKYTPPHGSISIKLEATDRFAKVTVSDTGEGIPAEALPRIFDAGFSINRENKVEVISHRLGLSIVKDLVERHGGTITVASTVGKGTTFCFTVPLVPILKTKEWRTEGATAKQLLLADDDPDIRQMLRDRLMAAGYIVTTASDGQQALSLSQGHEFHGIILDIGMPRISGLDVLSKIREEKPTIPIIMITAASSEERALLALQSGAHAYLLKPFDPGRLIELVDRVVGTST